MSTGSDRAELYNFLNAAGSERPNRKLHRLPREAYACSDCQYFFTLCARHQGRPFVEPRLARAVVEALLWRRRRHGWNLFAYCLMPDHLHFLVRLSEAEPGQVSAGIHGRASEGILDHVASFKKYTTTQVWWPHGGTGPLWQKSSYDRVLSRFTNVEEAAIYILNNPVRKGLVQDWREYPYAAIVDKW